MENLMGGGEGERERKVEGVDERERERVGEDTASSLSHTEL